MIGKLAKMELADMVPKEWFEDQDTSSFWLRIYTTLPVPQNRIDEYFKDAICTYEVNSQPIKLAILGLYEGFELFEVKNGVIHSHHKDGKMMIPVKLDKISFPRSSYIFFFAPYDIDGHEGDENQTKANLDQLEAILSTYLGSNTLHSLIYEGVHPLTDSCQSHNHGQAVQVLNRCDGPFLFKNNWEDCVELTSTINALADQEKKKRIEISLQYYQKGKNIFRSEEKFFFYWTAVTIVTADATTIEINKNLQNIYSQGRSFVENDLAWLWAVGCRNDFFKRGVRPNFHANRERYFQLLFLDLLRHELELAAQGHLLSYIQNCPDWNDH